jgi:hypothetical protein
VREADAEIYGRDAFWPADLVQVDEAWQGTNKLARLAVRPVQWNARSQGFCGYIRGSNSS